MAVPFKTGRPVSVAEKRMEPVTLRALADVRDRIDDLLDASEGELTPEIAEALDNWSIDFDAKVERVALAVGYEERRAEEAAEEAKRYSALAKTRGRRAESLKTYLFDQMKRTGRDKIEGAYRTVSVQKNNPSVRPLRELDEASLRDLANVAPFAVKIVPEQVQLNKSAILDQARVAGLHPNVAEYVEIIQTEGLRIR